MCNINIIFEQKMKNKVLVTIPMAPNFMNVP